MPPEAQLQGRLSKAGDVYSFGIWMWEVYTGLHAFDGGWVGGRRADFGG
jgi:hypothetical protein